MRVKESIQAYHQRDVCHLLVLCVASEASATGNQHLPMTPTLNPPHTNSLNQNWLQQDTEEHSYIYIYIYIYIYSLNNKTFALNVYLNRRHPYT